MRLFLLIIMLGFLPLSVSAEDFDQQINKACLRHAVSLVSRLKTDVIGELSQEQSDQALKLATESCQAYFKKEFSSPSSEVAAAAATEQEKKKSDSDRDWFTEMILKGESPDKKGNERLKRK